jgi:hypothetical protein
MIPFLIMIVLLALVLTYAARKPNTFRIERRLLIHAGPEKLFPLINDFHRWETWSPWEKIDPDMQRTFSGASHGKRATYAWQGLGRAGQGRMEILASLPYRKIIIQIDFIKPREALNYGEFTFDLVGNDTVLTWAMYGPCHYPHKLMCLFVNMDRTVGRDFEQGLKNLKHLAEHKDSHSSIQQGTLGA